MQRPYGIRTGEQEHTTASPQPKGKQGEKRRRALP